MVWTINLDIHIYIYLKERVRESDRVRERYVDIQNTNIEELMVNIRGLCRGDTRDADHPAGEVN